MKKLLPSIFKTILGMLFISLSFSSLAFAKTPTTPNKCQLAKVEFKKLYMDLQAQYLNYSGKDTVVDDKGNITLVPHKSASYEGKDFELAIFKEYQNSLKKVGRLFQEAKFGADKDELHKSSKTLVDFLKAIDSEDPSQYLVSSDINKVVNELAEASNKKFNGTKDDAFKITEQDKYLLKKLLTHAQDRICTVDHYNKTDGKEGTKYFTPAQILQYRNAPLNRMIGLIKKSGIEKDSDIKLKSEDELLVNGKVAVHSAIQEHMRQLADWMKKNTACKSSLANSNFLQADIQPCNYKRFLDSLEENNFNELESILHFINANDKFLDKKEKKADTDLNEIYLENFIDQTFNDLGKKVSCTRLIGEGKKEKFFVSNLEYDPNISTFKKDKIICNSNGKTLPEAQCHGNIKFVSDGLGRGIEVVNTNAKANIKFSLKGVPECNGIGVVDESDSILRTDLKTPEICEAEGKKRTPPIKLVPSDDKKTCIDPNGKLDLNTKPPFDADYCKAEGEKKIPKEDLVPNADGSACVLRNQKKPPFDADYCKAEGEKKIPKEDLVPNADGSACVLRDQRKPPFDADYCKAEGEKKNPKEDLVPNADGSACVKKETKKENVLDGQKACREKNTKWIKEENNGTPAIKWDWDGKDCIDKRPDQADEKGEAEEAGAPMGEDRPQTIPSRFVPLNIPTRGMYVLPGMP